MAKRAQVQKVADTNDILMQQVKKGGIELQKNPDYPGISKYQAVATIAGTDYAKNYEVSDYGICLVTTSGRAKMLAFCTNEQLKAIPAANQKLIAESSSFKIVRCEITPEQVLLF